MFQMLVLNFTCTLLCRSTPLSIINGQVSLPSWSPHTQSCPRITLASGKNPLAGIFLDNFLAGKIMLYSIRKKVIVAKLNMRLMTTITIATLFPLAKVTARQHTCYQYCHPYGQCERTDGLNCAFQNNSTGYKG